MSSDGDASRDEPAAPGGAGGTLNSEVGIQVMLSMVTVNMMMMTVTSGSKRLWTPPSLRRRAGTSVCAAGSQVWPSSSASSTSSSALAAEPHYRRRHPHFQHHHHHLQHFGGADFFCHGRAGDEENLARWVIAGQIKEQNMP